MRIFQNSSISKKLTMIIMFTCFVSLSLSALFLTIHTVICYRQNLVEKIEVLAKVTGHSLIFPLLFGNSTDTGETLKILSGEQQILFLAVMAAVGETFDEIGRGEKKFGADGLAAFHSWPLLSSVDHEPDMTVLPDESRQAKRRLCSCIHLIAIVLKR